jgi:hypothetical protein
MRVKIMVLCVCAWFLIQCKPDQPVSEKELHQALISSGNGQWFLENLTVDGMDETGMFAGLVITFTETNFTAVNGLPIWPESGSWLFTDESGKTILRDDQVSITVVEISESRLRLELQWDKKTYSGGRTNSLKGDHLFTFKR